jgi:transcriptional regulator with XRE-family HTH domain
VTNGDKKGYGKANRTYKDDPGNRGLSLRSLADIAGLHHSFLSKLELGAYDSVSAESLMALAEALDLPPADLFSLAGYRLPESLPSFGPYLRTRYGEELSDDDLSALTHMFEAMRSGHDETAGGSR